MDLQKIKDLKELQTILDLMARNNLAELEIEGDGSRIRLRKMEPRIAGESVVIAPEASAAAGVPASVESPSEAPDESPDDLYEVKSPLVGTFYRAPSPEADPFAQSGDRVDEDSVLCIVEAMKVMNEIRAGVSGIVREILVRNGESVEFGQPLFRVETE